MTLAQAAMTDTVKQPFTGKPFKDGPINPRLALGEGGLALEVTAASCSSPDLTEVLLLRNDHAANSLRTGTDSELRDLEALQ